MGVESWIAACWCTPCVIVENVKFALISPVSWFFLNMHIYILLLLFFPRAANTRVHNGWDCLEWPGEGFEDVGQWKRGVQRRRKGLRYLRGWVCILQCLARARRAREGRGVKELALNMRQDETKKGTEREKLESQRASGGWLIPAVLLWMLITSHPSIISVLVICVRASVAWIHADREMMMSLLACAASRCAVL